VKLQLSQTGLSPICNPWLVRSNLATGLANFATSSFSTGCHGVLHKDGTRPPFWGGQVSYIRLLDIFIKSGSNAVVVKFVEKSVTAAMVGDYWYS
jgi:hypothetical protein